MRSKKRRQRESEAGDEEATEHREVRQAAATQSMMGERTQQKQ